MWPSLGAAATWAVTYLVITDTTPPPSPGIDTGFIASIVAAVLSFAAAISVALIQVRHSRKGSDEPGDTALGAVLEELHNREVECGELRKDKDELEADRDEQAAIVRHLYAELVTLRGEAPVGLTEQGTDGAV